MAEVPGSADLERFLRVQEAVTELGRRRAALENRVAAVALFVAIPFGVLGVIVVKSWEHQALGVRSRGTGELGFFPPMILAALVARWVMRELLRARLDAWIVALAAAHDVTPEELRNACPG